MKIDRCTAIHPLQSKLASYDAYIMTTLVTHEGKIEPKLTEN